MSCWSISSQTSGPLLRAGGTAGQRCAVAGSAPSASVPAAAPATNARRVSLQECGLSAAMISSLVARALQHCGLGWTIASKSGVVSRSPLAPRRRACSIADQPDLALLWRFLGLCLACRIEAPFVIAALAQANRHAQAELAAEAAIGRQRRPALLHAVPHLEALEIIEIEEHADLRPLAAGPAHDGGNLRKRLARTRRHEVCRHVHVRLRDRLAQRIELHVVSRRMQIKRGELLLERPAVVLLRELAT